MALFVGISGRYFRCWLIVASLPIVSLVFLRGMVGPDTIWYEYLVEVMRVNDSYTFTFEPLFEYAIKFLAYQIDDSTNVMAVFSILTTVLLYLGSYRIERQPYLLAFCIVPYFYMDMTMNGIRYGLAFSIIVYGAHFLINGNKKTYLLLALSAALIQISSALLAIILLGLLEQRWRTIWITIICGITTFLFFDDYLQLKFDDNRSFVIASTMAGFAPLFLAGLTLIAFWHDRAFRKVGQVQILILAALSIFTYFITQFFYFGLRLQSLNLFLIYLFIACLVDSKKIRLNRKTILVVFLIGLLSTGFRLKNFYNDEGQGDSPFAPYHFFWER